MTGQHGGCRSLRHLSVIGLRRCHLPSRGGFSRPRVDGAIDSYRMHPKFAPRKHGGCLIKSQPLCKMHSSNSRAVHFAPPAGGLLNAQGLKAAPCTHPLPSFCASFYPVAILRQPAFCLLAFFSGGQEPGAQRRKGRHRHQAEGAEDRVHQLRGHVLVV